MQLEERINEDIKKAMKSKDADALRGIRAVKAAILLAKTDGSGKELNKEREISLLQKLVKQRKDSLEIYKKQDRPDLAEIEASEIETISTYLPTQMSEEEIRSAVKKLILDLGASSTKDMGKVMGAAKTHFAGKADGKTIAIIVKELLTT